MTKKQKITCKVLRAFTYFFGIFGVCLCLGSTSALEYHDISFAQACLIDVIALISIGFAFLSYQIRAEILWLVQNEFNKSLKERRYINK